jgi:hypothetical protein
MGVDDLEIGSEAVASLGAGIARSGDCPDPMQRKVCRAVGRDQVNRA